MAVTKLADLHLRGMTDAVGLPDVEIDTQAVEFWADGTVRFTLDTIEYRVHPSGTAWSRLFEKIFAANVTPLIGSE